MPTEKDEEIIMKILGENYDDIEPEKMLFENLWQFAKVYERVPKQKRYKLHSSTI